MRYRDFAPASATSASLLPDHIVTLHVRKGEFPRLEELMLTMDISLCGPIRRMPTGNAFVKIACRDATTAKSLQATW